MARLSLEGTSKKETSGALLRISQALHGLLNSLEEFREVETILGLETAAEDDHSGSNDRQIDETSPNFLRLVAGTLKEMVGNLVSDIEAKPEIQKLLLVTPKPVSGAGSDRSSLQDAAIRSQPSIPSMCISGIDSRTVKKAPLERAVTCRHSCEHHPELMDLLLWSTLPLEMVELVFASLPVARIIELCAHSMAWSTMSKSPDFRRVCFEKHPKLFGLVGWDKSDKTVCNVVYDIESNEWIFCELGGFSRSLDISVDHDRLGPYHDSIFASDGGLVCFVPEANLLSYPILVGNPLTDEWKALPRIPVEEMEVIIVQLVMEEDTKFYRVILVYEEEYIEKDGDIQYGAYCYDSKTGAWSKMDAGLVYGAYDPRVFDCTTKTLYELIDCSSLDTIIADIRGYTMVKDHLFVLHKWSPGEHVDKRFKVSEYAWQSSASDLSDLSVMDVSGLPTNLPRDYAIYFFACNGFVLLFADNCGKGEAQHQLIRLYDASANEWHSLSMGDDLRLTEHDLRSMYMCELRWDAVP